MDNVLRVDTIENTAGTISIPVSQLRSQVIQVVVQNYNGGEWNPDTTFRWLPGSYYDFTPKRSDSYIRYQFRTGIRWNSGTHTISHWKLMANGEIYYHFTVSGYHNQDGCNYDFDVPSWGKGKTSRIGFVHRSYTSDGNEMRIHSYYYWNHTSPNLNKSDVTAQLIIEEYTGA